MLLTGLYRRTIDEKQRIAVPKSLRGKLLTNELLYLTPGLDGCLAVYPESTFALLANRLAQASPAAKEVRDYSRLFYSQSHCVEPDRQGRFRLPAELATWAGLSGEVIVIGVGDHLELWPPEKWEGYASQRDRTYDELAEQALGEAVQTAPQAVEASTRPNVDVPEGHSTATYRPR